jgi:hypothetical protein
MKSKIATFLFVLSLFASCNRANNYIIQTDTEKFFSQKALTQEQSMEIGQQILTENRNNTIGRRIPSIIISDLYGEKIDLRKVLNQETIMIAGTPFCGYGQEEVEKNFPKMLRNLDADTVDFKVICLVITENGEPNTDEISFGTQLRSEYKNIYFIDNKEAVKINIWASPTKFFIDKNQFVVYYSMGYIIEEGYRRQEIENGINLMFKKLL